MNSEDDAENYDDDDDHGDDMNGEIEYKDRPHLSCCSVKDKVMRRLEAWECDKAFASLSLSMLSSQVTYSNTAEDLSPLKRKDF